MKNELLYLFYFVGFCFIIYVLFRNVSKLNLTEGMNARSDASGSSAGSSSGSGSSENGIAGNAKQFGSAIKAASVKLSDQLLISKYRADYETVILNMEEMVSNLMVKTVLSIDQSNPEKGLASLAALTHAKAALADIMKYVDSQ
jgi:hypothetical protein